MINWNRPTNGASSAAPFGGIGVAIHKAPEPGAPLKVLDVQADGPAGQATSMNTSGFDRQLDADARASMARGNGVEMGNGMGSRM